MTKENIITTPIIDEVEQSFLDYSLSVITDRAIPSAEDGLKPVTRRILYMMNDSGYTHNKKFVKAAKPVGEVMSRLHPHGDASIYDALAALSQPWTMRYPLVEWHGNNGSRDGDEQAASRYTECRLSLVGEEMLDSIKKNTVDWQLTYTDEEEEPIYLPARIPNLLVNGTFGIAVAFSCSFASHNLCEILDAATKVLETPNVDIKSLLKIVHGPDFPTGAQIINKDELITVYTTGKGRVRVRAEYNIEKNKNQTTTIAFTSIPYKVSKEKLAIDIDKLCEAGTITGVTAIRDESNQEGVRFVVELDKNTNPEAVVKKLFKHTALEDVFNINQVALVDKKPKLLNLKELLEIYVNHQRDVLLRKTKFDLDKIEARIHILEGLLIALEDIDNVIKLIKESDSATAAKTSLINKYLLSEVQAKAILDMKLSRLAKLEKIEIQQEKEKLLIEKSNLKAIIENPVPELKRIFEELKNKYDDARRTKITQIDDEESTEDIPVIPKEKCVVLLSEDGKIKRTPAKNYRPQKRNGKGLKNKEDAPAQAINTDTHDELLIFTNTGKVLLQRVSNLDDNYSYLSKDKISFIYSLGINKGNTVIFATKNGLIKKVSDIKSLIPARFGRETSVISLKNDDELIRVSSFNDDENVIIITQNGKAIKFKNEEVPEYATKTAAGVKGITLDKDDYVVSVELVNNNENMLGIFLSNGTGKKINLKDFVTQKRGGKGVSLLKANSKSKIVNTCILNNEDSVLICGKNTSICLTSEEIPLGNRATETKLLIKDSEVISVYKI